MLETVAAIRELNDYRKKGTIRSIDLARMCGRFSLPELFTSPEETQALQQAQILTTVLKIMQVCDRTQIINFQDPLAGFLKIHRENGDDPNATTSEETRLNIFYTSITDEGAIRDVASFRVEEGEIADSRTGMSMRTYTLTDSNPTSHYPPIHMCMFAQTRAMYHLVASPPRPVLLAYKR